MSVFKSYTCLSVVATLSILAGCGGTDTPQPSVKVAKAYESPQCQPPSIPPAILQELVGANIEVRARLCGIDPEVTVGASCALPFTKYLIIEIPENQKPRAQSLGYKEVSEFPPLNAQVC